MIAILRRRRGRHCVADEQPHQGWERREHELQLLATDPPPVTVPIRGLPPQTVDACVVDQCPWPTEQRDGVDQMGRLLEHMRCVHPTVDYLNTIMRLRRAVTKLQERTP